MNNDTNTSLGRADNMDGKSIQLLDYFNKMNSQDIILYYKGPFDDDIMAKISKFLREGLVSSPKTGHKLFSVFIELAQNIAYYSKEVNVFGERDEHSRGIGTVMVTDNGTEFEFTAGNLIEEANVEELIDKCDEINLLDYDGLRALKREIRSNPRREGHKGGNIGLIQVAIKSQRPLRVRSQPIDEKYSFFTISTVVDK